MYMSEKYQTFEHQRRSREIRRPFYMRLLGLVKAVFRFGRKFCLETSMHGFNHVALPGRYWIERLLWIFATSAAIWGALSISMGQLTRYNENPTVVALEKDFRSWRFSLPAVTCCPANRVSNTKVPQVIKDLWDVDPGHEKYPYYKNFVTTVANSDLYHLEGMRQFKDDPSLEVDLFRIVLDVMPEHNIKATWSSSENARWIPVMTEAGACYVANSVAIADIVLEPLDANETKILPLTCKYSSLSCFVILEISSNADFYVHSSYDIADIMVARSRCFLTLNRVTELSVMESRCGKGVEDLTPKRRGCRYNNEPPDEGKKIYSTNTCRRACRNRLAVKLCGCKPFYNFYEDGVPCSTAGMICLSNYAHLLENNEGQQCVCASQCVHSVYKELVRTDQIWERGPFVNRGSVRYTVQAPRTRYTREIVFHFQDLIVSFGGAAGLFLGASFISFVEILYFLGEWVLGCVCGQTKQPEVSLKKAKQEMIPFEMVRMMKLTSLLEHQKKYDQRLDEQLYQNNSYYYRGHP